MDIESLENYKKQRTILQKSFISRLNDTLTEILDEQSEQSLIMRSIYRTKFDTFISDTTRKIKEEVTNLRLIKKWDAKDVLKNDIQNIIDCKSSMPDSRNPYEWLTKFRTKISSMDCFTRTVLFDKIDCPSLWDYNMVEYLTNRDIPTLEEMPDDEQSKEMIHIVSKLVTADNKYIEEPSEEFFDTITGQMSMNI